MDTNKSGNDLGFERHPLAYLVEAADDICYTIDFEDGINLGLVSEDFALEYLIKLVKDNIGTSKYKTLETRKTVSVIFVSYWKLN
jgi:dGTPase